METVEERRGVVFDVLYDDGTSRRVDEGLLIESQDREVVIHPGTSSLSVIFAAVKALLTIIASLGAWDAFISYASGESVQEGTD